MASRERAAAIRAAGGAAALLAVAVPGLIGVAAWGVEWETAAGLELSAQGYSSGQVDETILAADLDGWIRARLTTGWDAFLLFGTDEDLYGRGARASLSASRRGEVLDVSLGASLDRSEPGALGDPLLFFDPDSLLAQATDEAATSRAGASAGLDWHAGRFDLGLDLAHSDLRYDAPSAVLADQRETVATLGLDLPFGLDWQVELEGSALSADFRQRGASDAEERSGLLRLRWYGGAGWELSLAGEALRREVADAANLVAYERPGGARRSLELLVDRLALDGLDASLLLRATGEDWEDYGGYYRDGAERELELLLGRELGGGARLDGFFVLAAFTPDEIASDGWTAERGEELRRSGELLLTLGEGGRAPLGLSATLEDMRVRAGGEDSFRLFEIRADLGWRLHEAWRWRFAGGVDRYRSRFAEEAAETEWGLSGDLALIHRRGHWELELGAERGQRFSYLAESETVVDWRAGLEIRWHP